MYSNEDYLLDLIVESGLITHEDITIYRNNLTGDQSVIELMIREHKLTEEQVAQVSANSSSLDYIDLATTAVPPDMVDKIPEDISRRFKVVAVMDDGNYLTVALADPLNFEALDTLPHLLGREISPVCATPSAIAQTIEHNFGSASGDSEASEGVSWSGGEEDEADENDAPIIKLVSHVLVEAFKMRASDIHIEPLEASLRIRYRIDGKLIEAEHHPKKLLPAIIARLKVMSGTMSIAEKRLPQDGRIQIQVSGKDVDLRVSSVPSNHGESIVMRILDKSSLVLGLAELGFYSDDQDRFRRRRDAAQISDFSETGMGLRLYGVLGTRTRCLIIIGRYARMI